MEDAGIEWSGFLLDQCLGQFQKLLVRLGIADVAEIRRGLVHFVGIAKRFQHHAPAAGLQADHIFASAERQLASPTFLVLRSASRSRSEEHTSELQSLMRTSYAGFCLKKQNKLHKDNKIIEQK